MEWLGIAVAPLCFAGFSAMALSMDRHHREVLGGPCPPRVRQKLRRRALILFLTATATAVSGRAIGIVGGVLGASLAAGAVVAVLGLRPELLARRPPAG